MGVISILLGFIAFFCFTGVGAILADRALEWKAVLALQFTSLNNTSNATLVAIIVGAFAFIGLMIGMNLIMHGLTYNKVAKMQTQLRRRG